MRGEKGSWRATKVSNWNQACSMVITASILTLLIRRKQKNKVSLCHLTKESLSKRWAKKRCRKIENILLIKDIYPHYKVVVLKACPVVIKLDPALVFKYLIADGTVQFIHIQVKLPTVLVDFCMSRGTGNGLTMFGSVVRKYSHKHIIDRRPFFFNSRHFFYRWSKTQTGD